MLALAFHYVGTALCMNSRFQEAMPHLLKSKEIRESLPRFKPEWLFNSFYHLGLASHYIGDNEHAVTVLNRALRDRIDALGENDSESMRYELRAPLYYVQAAFRLIRSRTGALYYVLGNVRLAQREYELSFQNHSKALDHLVRTIGESNPATLQCMLKIAVRYPVKCLEVAILTDSHTSGKFSTHTMHSYILSLGRACLRNIILAIDHRLRC